MKAWIPLTLVFALGTAAHPQATCTYPSAPESPPDGNNATKDQMVAAKHDFDRYNGEMNSYLDCLKLEMDAATPKDPKKPRAAKKKQGAIMVPRNSAAVDELQAVVGRFNEQLKIYKAKAAAAPKS